MNTDFYIKQYQRRRKWEVIPVSNKQSWTEEATRTLQKALAVSALELPVMDMIYDEANKHHNLEEPVLKLLMANAEDEIKHDKALGRLKEILPPKSEDISFMNDVVKEAARLGEQMSPITVAGALEVSIFFVVLPMYRFLGGSAFRTIANDISNDENIHVATNVNLARDWGYKRRPSLNRLRLDVMDWLTEDLPEFNNNKYLSSNHWMKASHNLYHNNKSEELAETKKAVMPSFFERSNHDLPIYG